MEATPSQAREAIITAFNAAEIECFYEGVRIDIMIKSGVHGKVFHDLFGTLSFYQLATGKLVAYFE